MVRNASEILHGLLGSGHSTIAGRLAGALRNIGKAQLADEIIKTMGATSRTVREHDPFEAPSPLNLEGRQLVPHVTRLRLMWEAMRSQIEGQFPKAPRQPKDIEAYLKQLDRVYVSDAYHSLSIEGYRVSPELIEQIRTGNWHPEANAQDLEQHNALAALGYWQAFQQVRASVRRILEGENLGEVVKATHPDWYRELFGAHVQAGLLTDIDLAGYRNMPVYIRQSKHVPPRREAVADLMEAFFDLLSSEADAATRVVLGHFVFVHIHPYMDGNGRIGRFLMNAMLAAGGYPWTVIPVGQRSTYMDALEVASTEQNIVPFASFLGGLVAGASKPPAVPT